MGRPILPPHPHLHITRGTVSEAHAPDEGLGLEPGLSSAGGWKGKVGYVV